MSLYVLTSTPPKKRYFRGSKQHAKNKKKKKEDLRFHVTSEKYNEILASNLDLSEYIVFDIETTGGNPERNGMTEFCGILIQNGEVKESFDTLINPEIPIPPIVRRMTGINDKMVRNAPKIDQVMPKILDFIGDRIVVSHNTIGDLKFIRYFAKKVSHHIFDNFFICTHLLSEKYLSASPDKSLKGLANYLDLHFEGAHRAEADARITWELLKKLISEAKKDGINEVKELIRKQGDYESSFRLGWGVKKETLRSLPGEVGNFIGLGHDGKQLFVGSAFNVKKQVHFLTQYNELPKPMLKKVFRTYDIKFEKRNNFLEALAFEANLNRQQGLDSIGPFINQKRLLTFYLERAEDSGWALYAGHCSSSAHFCFGPVFDRKFASMILRNIAQKLELEQGRNKLKVEDAHIPAIIAYLTGSVDHMRDGLQKNGRSFLTLLNKRKRRFVFDSLQQLDRIRDLKKEATFCDLHRLNGTFYFYENQSCYECEIKDSRIVRQKKTERTLSQQNPKISPVDIKPTDAKIVMNSILNPPNSDRSFDVWEFLCWSVFSNRGRKHAEFVIK